MRWNSSAGLAPLGIVRGHAAQPVGAHLHVRHLIGQHPVLAEVQDRVAGGAAELAHGVEHVDGQALERPVDTGQTKDGVGVAGGLEQQGLLGELADLGAHVLGELHRDLHVAGLVPALAGHVELELERDRIALGADGEVPAGATGALERLDLAHEDAVHQAAGGIRRLVAVGAEPGAGVVGQGDAVAGVEDEVLDAHALEPLVAGQLGDRHVSLHALLLDLRRLGRRAGWVGRCRRCSAIAGRPSTRVVAVVPRPLPARRSGGRADGRAVGQADAPGEPRTGS